MRSLHDLIIETAERALELQSQNGALPAGHNGPYGDPETPVRNTAHWLVTFLKAGEISGEERFDYAADRAVRYLLSDDARPADHSFVHRDVDDKDRCNGLIGQAWTIEGLAAAVDSGIRREAALEAARNVFLMHPFSERFGLWKRVEPDGEVLPYDRTFNHQLWFAATGGLLVDASKPDAVSEVDRRVRTFLDRLPETMRLFPDGLVRHPLRPKFSVSEYLSLVRPGDWRLAKNQCLAFARPPRSRRRLRSKAIGYHSFNLHGLALLNRSYPNHPVWSHGSIDRALRFLNTEIYRTEIGTNPYGYPYNPPGFENAFALERFGTDESQQIAEWVSRQIDRCYDHVAGLMTGCSEDEATAAARMYEATVLDDVCF